MPTWLVFFLPLYECVCVTRNPWEMEFEGETILLLKYIYTLRIVEVKWTYGSLFFASVYTHLHKVEKLFAFDYHRLYYACQRKKYEDCGCGLILYGRTYILSK